MGRIPLWSWSISIEEAKRPGLVIAGVLVLVSVTFLVLGGMMLRGAPDTDSTTTGEITSVVDKGSSCSAVARFEVAGEEHQARTTVDSSTTCDQGVGDRVEVHFASSDPSVNEFGTRQASFGWIVLGIGLALVAGALVAAGWEAVRWRREHREAGQPGT